MRSSNTRPLAGDDGSSPSCTRSTRTSTAFAGPASSRSRRRAAGNSRSRRGPTAGRPTTTSCAARSRPTSTRTSRARSPRASCYLERALALAKGDAKDSIQYAYDVLSAPDTPMHQKFDVALGPGALPVDARVLGARGRDDAREADRARGRPRQGPLRRLVRALPALLGRPEGRRRARAGDRRARLRRPLPAAVPPDRRQEPQGPQQLARRRPGRSRARRTRSAAPRAATSPSTPSSAPSRTCATSCTTAHHHGMDVALDIALNASADHPWLTEHPEWFQQRPDGTLKYAENPPKRYQDIYNFNWDTPEWESLWQAWLDVFLHWTEARDQVLPRRQPAHEAVPVLGVADQGGPQGRPRRGLPRGGLHAARGHAGAGASSASRSPTRTSRGRTRATR